MESYDMKRTPHYSLTPTKQFRPPITAQQTIKELAKSGNSEDSARVIMLCGLTNKSTITVKDILCSVTKSLAGNKWSLNTTLEVNICDSLSFDQQMNLKELCTQTGFFKSASCLSSSAQAILDNLNSDREKPYDDGVNGLHGCVQQQRVQQQEKQHPLKRKKIPQIIVLNPIYRRICDEYEAITLRNEDILNLAEQKKLLETFLTNELGPNYSMEYECDLLDDIASLLDTPTPATAQPRRPPAAADAPPQTFTFVRQEEVFPLEKMMMYQLVTSAEFFPQPLLTLERIKDTVNEARIIGKKFSEMYHYTTNGDNNPCEARVTLSKNELDSLIKDMQDVVNEVLQPSHPLHKEYFADYEELLMRLYEIQTQ